MSPKQRIGKLASRHGIRSKNGVRSGTTQLFAGFFFRGTNDKGELRIESFRRVLVPTCVHCIRFSARPLNDGENPRRLDTMKIQTDATFAIATYSMMMLLFVRILPRLQHAFGIASAPGMPRHRAQWPPRAFLCSCGPSGPLWHSSISYSRRPEKARGCARAAEYRLNSVQCSLLFYEKNAYAALKPEVCLQLEE